MRKETIGNATLYLGDSSEVLQDIQTVHAVVTDPPYGLSFMGKSWDYDVPKKDLWETVRDRLLPGGHLLSFGGTRTYHRMVVEIEDAGFEIRDQLQWLYGTGFPKSHDIGKAIDKSAGAKRQVTPSSLMDSNSDVGKISRNRRCDACGPVTYEAKQWDGWGTALKPANEPITMARKPLSGTVASNVLEHGTGALNIEACRVGMEPMPVFDRLGQPTDSSYMGTTKLAGLEMRGRWPANVLHDGSDCVREQFPINKSPKGFVKQGGRTFASETTRGGTLFQGHGDEGSASRFFYCAKPSKKERGEYNLHPTVKPVSLMRHLVRLVTPPGGVVLDPFMGSCSTGLAAIQEGFSFIGIERDPEYFEIALRRIEDWSK